MVARLTSGRWLLAALLGWTIVVVGAVLYFGPQVPRGGCWRLVNASAECLAELARIHEQIWWTQTPPKLVVFVAGYVVIVSLALARLRAARRGAA